MIRINKGPAPDFLQDEKKKWYKETQKAIKHYEVDKKLEAFPFKSYNDSLLKTELFKYFHKCAYCEGKFAATSDGDVEHFRPKGRVAGKNPPTPGYYWLANDWDNLLLSCQHCNQGRVHILEGDFRNAKGKRGKEDQFPLRAPGVWTPVRGPVQDEEAHRLLINPCIDDPEIHFDYDPVKGVLIAKTDQAEKSIEVFALGRKRLVDLRKEMLASLLSQLDLLLMLMEDYNLDPDERNKNKLAFAVGTILNMTSNTAQFAGMNRFFVRRFLAKNQIHLPIPDEEL